MLCPSCGSARVFPSRLRHVLERMRQAATGKRPYRCHKCGWRRWGDAPIPAEDEGQTTNGRRRTREVSPAPPVDVDKLDSWRR
jgi:hypothetical protein